MAFFVVVVVFFFVFFLFFFCFFVFCFCFCCFFFLFFFFRGGVFLLHEVFGRKWRIFCASIISKNRPFLTAVNVNNWKTIQNKINQKRKRDKHDINLLINIVVNAR